MRVPKMFLVTSAIVFSTFTSAWATEILVKENTDGFLLNGSTYWTPERMRSAKPIPLPNANLDALHKFQSKDLKMGDPEGGDGAPPSVEIKPNAELLYDPLPLTDINTQQTLERGTSNYNFSSSRLVPIVADLIYPYSAVGKLFFTKPDGGNFVCSASVIRHRVLLTAGHCVHKGSGGVAGFYKNWLFVPAFRDGLAPFQSWNWKYVVVTGAWATGNGSIPNPADYAMLELEDRSFVGIMRRIGDVTGYLGYQTQSLIPNHAHLLGYPCNLDGCQKMHQVTAQSASVVEPNNVIYGSDMFGGTSGGPWVQNFGALADGQVNGTNPGRNRVIGISSWGPVHTAMFLGSSIPDTRFTEILNMVCNHKAGNCS